LLLWSSIPLESAEIRVTEIFLLRFEVDETRSLLLADFTTSSLFENFGIGLKGFSLRTGSPSFSSSPLIPEA
jgi:hypothetical protein